MKKLEELEKKREAGTNAYATEDLRALLLERTGKKDEAVALIRRSVGRPGAARGGRDPDRRPVAAEKFAEAFTLCEQTWEKWPDNKVRPEALGAATVSLLRAMRPTDDQVARLERRLKGAIAREPGTARFYGCTSPTCTTCGHATPKPKPSTAKCWRRSRTTPSR